MSINIKKEEIDLAYGVVKQFCHNTPVLSSLSINIIAGCELFFKCENFQKIGAFKMRGAAYALSKLTANEKQNGVITHSSGNHAQAVALAAKLQGIKAEIVMPRTAPKVKVKGVESYGGKITFCEPTISARQETVDQIKSRTKATFIPPYDHKDIITGQATCAKELLEEKPEIEVLICPVGGGGLLSGTILASDFYGNKTKVYAGEPEEVDDAYRSIKSGKIEKNKTTNTIADGLKTDLGELNFSIIKDGVEKILLVNEAEIKSAMRLIWERMKIIIEPSCAVPLAAILRNKELFKNKKVGVILTGGNVDLDKFFKTI